MIHIEISYFFSFLHYGFYLFLDYNLVLFFLKLLLLPCFWLLFWFRADQAASNGFRLHQPRQGLKISLPLHRETKIYLWFSMICESGFWTEPFCSQDSGRLAVHGGQGGRGIGGWISPTWSWAIYRCDGVHIFSVLLWVITPCVRLQYFY